MTAYTWIGGASGDWNNPDNWSPSGVPGAGDTVAVATAESITVEGETVASVFGGGSTTLAGDLTVTGTMSNVTIAAGTQDIGTAAGVTINDGIVTIGSATSVTVAGGTVDISTASAGTIAGGTVSLGTANQVTIDGGTVTASLITGPGWSVVSGGQVDVTDLDLAMIEGGTVSAGSVGTSATVSSANLMVGAFTSTAAMWIYAGGSARISGSTLITGPTAGEGTLGTLSGGLLTLDGSLTATAGGFVDVDGTTAITGSATVDNSNLYVAFHGSGGELDAASLTLHNGVFQFWNSGGYAAIGGGTTGHAQNQVQIGASGSLVGYGKVSGPSLFIDDDGNIEAQGGKLVLAANVETNGIGQVLIDPNATLELGGSFGAVDTVKFQSNGSGSLILDDLPHFGNSASPAIVTGMQLGDKIVLPFTSGGKIVAVTIGMLNGVQTLQIRENRQHIDDPRSPGTTIYNVQIRGTAGDGSLKGDYFQVTQTSNGVQNSKGSDTTLTLAEGNPVALSINAPAARQASGANGSGVKIGIISDSFNQLGGMSSDIDAGALNPNIHILQGFEGPVRTDEGRAMGQIIYDIAPGASIDFATGFGGPSVMASAIRALQADGCQIIVDDVYYQPWAEQLLGGAINQAIDAASRAGVTYVTAAGNDRLRGTPIYGHRLDPFALTVAAMNLLATPSSISTVGGYIQLPQTEPFSSIGTAGSKPDITGPDGGPTTLPLYPGSRLDPFFGTSAAAPAVAAVAALMLSENFQLRHNPKEVTSLLTSNALDFGEPFSQEGSGLVQADRAVGAVPTVIAFVNNAPTQASSTATAAGPTVISAALSQPAGDVDSGAIIQLQVTLSAAVTVSGGTPGLTLNDNAAATYDAAASDPANAVLVFDYAVGATERTPNLALTGINLNGATIQDASGNSADFSALFGAPTGVSVNSSLTVSSVTASGGGEVDAGQTTELILTFDAAVTVNSGGGLPSLTLGNAATASYDSGQSNPAGGTLVFDYTVAAGDEPVPNLAIQAVNLPTGTTVQDAAGNNADFAGALNSDTGLQVGPAFVDAIATSSTGSAKTGQLVELTLTMSQAVVVNIIAGSPTLTLNDGATASYDAVAGNPSADTLVFDYTVASPDQTPSLAITQVNLNGGSLQDANGVDVDFSAALNFPALLSINSPLLITDASSSLGGRVAPGQTIEITLTTNEALQIDTLDNFGNDPSLTLNDGAKASYDSAATEAASNAIVFDYTVGVADHTADLAITGIDLPGPIFTDSLGYQPDFSAILGTGIGVSVGQAAANDFDADGASEILLTSTATGDFVDWTMSGSQITSAQQLTFGGAPVALDSSWSVAGTGDLNGDGKTDILLQNASGSFVDWTMNGPAIAAAANLDFNGAAVGLDPSWSVAGVGDFSGDGDADILLHSTSGSFVDWTMNASTITGATNLTFNGAAVALDPSWSVAGVGDFDGDGKADILLRSSTTGAFVDWTMNGATIAAAQNLTFNGAAVGLDGSWQVLGTGDFDGDGKADILLGGSDGTFVDWAMNGSAIASAAELVFQGNPVKLDPSWTFSDIGDYDGDGKSDILLRNSGNGSFVDWTMNGATIVGAQNLTFQGSPVLLDNSWKTH